MGDRKYLCRQCSLRHAPRCPSPGPWPLADLLELAPPGFLKSIKASGETIQKARTEGLSDVLADRWAIAAGHHPSAVWPGWYDAGLTVNDRIFLETGWRRAWLHQEPSSTPTTAREAA